MKTKIQLIAFAILFVIPMTIFSQRTIKTMAFNIFHGATMNDNYEMDVFADIINQEAPDFVALQEVDFKTRRAKGYDIASEIGLRCKMAPLFARSMSYDGGEYGIGVLSKYPILESKQLMLPHNDDEEPRLALMIKVAIETDTIWFISTHFGYKYEDVQEAQAKAITDFVSSQPYPAIMGGDLNAEPGSKAINYLEGHWLHTYDKDNPEFTFPSDNPTKKIDYLYCFPKDRWTVISDKVIYNSEASDHLPYAATLQLN